MSSSDARFTGYARAVNRRATSGGARPEAARLCAIRTGEVCAYARTGPNPLCGRVTLSVAVRCRALPVSARRLLSQHVDPFNARTEGPA
jgi:hypothetical protein